MRTIVWDVDDVLNDLMKLWFEKAWLSEHPECHLTYKSISENPPHKLLSVSLNDYLDSLDKFRFILSQGVIKMDPIPAVVEWFQIHGYKFRHIALTSVPIQFAPFSASWVLKHFGHWIRSFHFVPSRRANEKVFSYDSDKADYLKWWGKADLFIDDNPSNVEAVNKIGIHNILMPRPWNKNTMSISDTLNSIL